LTPDVWRGSVVQIAFPGCQRKSRFLNRNSILVKDGRLGLPNEPESHLGYCLYRCPNARGVVLYFHANAEVSSTHHPSVPAPPLAALRTHRLHHASPAARDGLGGHRARVQAPECGRARYGVPWIWLVRPQAQRIRINTPTRLCI